MSFPSFSVSLRICDARGNRFSEVTASARTLPARTCGRIDEITSHTMCICPPRTIINHHLLAHLLAEFACKTTCRDVRRAAGCRWHDQPYRSGRVRLRIGNAGCEQDRCGYGDQRELGHAVLTVAGSHRSAGLRRHDNVIQMVGAVNNCGTSAFRNISCGADRPLLAGSRTS